MTQKKKLVYLGTKAIGAACLQYLLQQADVLNIEVIAVGTKERKDLDGAQTVVALAQQYQIPLLASADEIPDCDFIYSVQYHEILKQAHIAKAKEIAVNLHLAPLPDYRGCNQFSFAIVNDAKEFGVTIHQINTGIDSGDILFEDRFELPKDIWVKDLVQIATQKGIDLFQHTLQQLITGSYTLRSQEDLIAERGTHLYFRKDIAALKVIDLTEAKPLILKKLRATYMPGFELPYALVDGKKVYIDLADFT